MAASASSFLRSRLAGDGLVADGLAADGLAADGLAGEATRNLGGARCLVGDAIAAAVCC